jgi:hypothetical protein
MHLGLSECARATTAQESQFRVNYPNSKPRVSRIIALDAQSLSALTALKDYPWNGARFLRYLRARAASENLPILPIDAVLEDLEGNQVSLTSEIADADVVVMVTMAGTEPDAAEIIGNACFVRAKMTTGLVLKSEGNGADLARTLRAMRPFAAMLVVATGEEYVGEMLTALRA